MTGSRKKSSANDSPIAPVSPEARLRARSIGDQFVTLADRFSRQTQNVASSKTKKQLAANLGELRFTTREFSRTLELRGGIKRQRLLLKHRSEVDIFALENGIQEWLDQRVIGPTERIVSNLKKVDPAQDESPTLAAGRELIALSGVLRNDILPALALLTSLPLDMKVPVKQRGSKVTAINMTEWIEQVRAVFVDQAVPEPQQPMPVIKINQTTPASLEAMDLTNLRGILFHIRRTDRLRRSVLRELRRRAMLADRGAFDVLAEIAKGVRPPSRSILDEGRRYFHTVRTMFAQEKPKDSVLSRLSTATHQRIIDLLRRVPADQLTAMADCLGETEKRHSTGKSGCRRPSPKRRPRLWQISAKWPHGEGRTLDHDPKSGRSPRRTPLPV